MKKNNEKNEYDELCLKLTMVLSNLKSGPMLVLSVYLFFYLKRLFFSFDELPSLQQFFVWTVSTKICQPHVLISLLLLFLQKRFHYAF